MNSPSHLPWWRTIIVVAAVISSACGGVRYPQNYLLDVQPTKPVAASSQDTLGPLMIREFRCPDYLCDGRIVYRPTPHEVGFYEYHRWAVSPRQMITESIASSVRGTAMFATVSLRGRNTAAEYLLTGAVERLEEVDQGGDVHALCVLSAELIETGTKRIVWSGSETAMVRVSDRNMNGVVAGLSTATREAVDALVGSMQERMRTIRSER